MPLRRAVDLVQYSSYRQLQPVWQSSDATLPRGLACVLLCSMTSQSTRARNRRTKDAGGHSAEHQHDIARGGAAIANRSSF
jgi:hypothetical protein